MLGGIETVDDDTADVFIQRGGEAKGNHRDLYRLHGGIGRIDAGADGEPAVRNHAAEAQIVAGKGMEIDVRDFADGKLRRGHIRDAA